MDKHVAITDVFQHAVENLTSCTPYEKAIISKNISELNYLDDILKRNKKVFQQLIHETASAIYKRTIPADVMSLSAIIYKGKKAGLDISRLHRAMHNNGEWLMQEEMKHIKESRIIKFLN